MVVGDRGPIVWACVALLLGVACGDDSATGSGGSTSTCPEGVICGTGAGETGGQSAGGSSAGGQGTGGSGACVEAWACTPWDTNPPGSDNGVRTCTDKNMCGTTAQKPVETATLPALDLNYYKCEVEPILDRTCSSLGCHGRDDRGLRTYSRGRFRNVSESVPNPCPGGGMQSLANCVGSIECGCYVAPHTATEWQRNFDAARGLALDLQGMLLGDMNQSELIQQPFTEGAKPHAGIKQFSMSDAEYTTLIDWLEGTALGNCNTTN